MYSSHLFYTKITNARLTIDTHHQVYFPTVKCEESENVCGWEWETGTYQDNIDIFRQYRQQLDTLKQDGIRIAQAGYLHAHYR